MYHLESEIFFYAQPFFVNFILSYVSVEVIE